MRRFFDCDSGLKSRDFATEHLQRADTKDWQAPS
jgi:hypothetical protein